MELDYYKSIEGKSPEEVAQIKMDMFIGQARTNPNPDGFEAFYELIFHNPFPPHAREWVTQIYNDYAAGKGTVIRAFRGSTKTTTLTIGLAAFLVGHNPAGSGMLIQVGDDIATDNAAQVADIIENNPGWKFVFPNVVPDRERGWGAGGYEVKLADMEYGDWRAQNAERKDPTFIGLGYKSRAIIGKHPTNFLFVDDIHDENNTSSDRELDKVKRIVTGTIFPTMMPDTMRVFIGTPWNEEDVLEYVMGTGEYNELNTAVVTPHPDNPDLVRPTWPELFNKELIARKRRESGEAEFARMYLLDLTKAKVGGLKFFSYPHEAISSEWPMAGGVDYASIDPDRPGKERDYFAMAYGAKIPTGGLVVVDGIRDHVTQMQAEAHVEKAQGLWPGWIHAVVEGDGKGEEFIAVLFRKPHLRILPMKTGGKGKQQRLGRQMAPWLENGLVRISDADTPFLNALRKELRDYPNGRHDDCLDAVYWLMRGVQDVLQMESETESIRLPRHMQRNKVGNPFASLGRR